MMGKEYKERPTNNIGRSSQRFIEFQILKENNIYKKPLPNG